MNLNKIEAFYFLGIGGIGMSSLARYFHSMGKKVSGYDRYRTSLTTELEKEGIFINYKDDTEMLPKWINSSSTQCLIVYTPSIPDNHRQWIFLKKRYGKNIKKRSQVLALITKNKTCIAIGGTHGKTTTCTLLGHILYSAGKKFTAFLGGISENYQSNLILNGTEIFLVEADEFDHSFLYLSPNIACITSLDRDHIDTYPKKEALIKAYVDFYNKLENPYKKLFLCQEEEYFPYVKNNVIHYSVEEKEGDYYSNNISIKENKWYFDFHTPKETWKSLFLPIPGLHNLKNVTAALAISDYLKINSEKIRKSLFLFKGIKRRYSIHYKSRKKIYIDDYAHHPTEINALISTIRKCFPDKKILGIFQPHLFSRTKFFEKDFAKSLENLDLLILLDIYPARELPIDGISSNNLLDKIKMNYKNKELSTISKVLEIIPKKNFDILLTIGAGNIDTLIQPIKKWLHKKYG
ncbi:MAG: UDP-N-acetylmuramate--L-alanine ligase [Flavobacteriales bacterium]|uniref:UDP-N-acetylmuramate--L-alanine ligase n=1 Tax=Blattabacterium sp. (Mastotermes darwiniensis) TaxID=39768 RepID=UPI00059AF818|nr:UDP-N-acetylmuramate--L-alanine ligase [Blattabacterium sp. (Mastotermes darwiniensis)]MDR1804844.1 UDP-N-acetylmuramate--L-alanine ligase [Flavobacteriales bacterium]